MLLISVFQIYIATEFETQSSIASDFQFQSFVNKYKKTYASSEEFSKRKAIYMKNVRKVSEHNKKYFEGKVCWKEEIKEDSDLTFQEWKAKEYIQIKNPN